MKGVTILNEEKRTITDFLDCACIAIAVVCFAIIAVLGFIDGIIVGSVMCLLASIMFAFLFVANVTDKSTRYKVKIDKSSLDSSFVTTYKVIEWCGDDIFIVEKI